MSPSLQNTWFPWITKYLRRFTAEQQNWHKTETFFFLITILVVFFPHSNENRKLNIAPQRLMPMSREIISPEAGEVSGTQLPMDGTTHAQLWRIAFFLFFFYPGSSWQVENWEIPGGRRWRYMVWLIRAFNTEVAWFIHSFFFFFQFIKKQKKTTTLYHRHVAAISRQHVFGGPC